MRIHMLDTNIVTTVVTIVAVLLGVWRMAESYAATCEQIPAPGLGIVTTVVTIVAVLLGVWRMAESVLRADIGTLTQRVNTLVERVGALAERVAAIEGALNGRLSRPYSMEGVQTREQKD